MRLENIYRPIKKELIKVDNALKASLKNEDASVSDIAYYLLAVKGKRLRSAMVILSAKASRAEKRINERSIISIAAALELIHMSSLIHDDVLDKTNLRHNRPTINARWGQDVSIALGDYLYSIGFDLIASCKNPEILSCVSQATKAMCEGELVQVSRRNNLELLKEQYIVIVKKKTASLFAASCQAGAMISNNRRSVHCALKEYGLNFGIAFQIIDDCMDLIGTKEDLGKPPGVDFKMGELTLPVLNLLSQSKDKDRIISLIRQQANPEAFEDLRERFIDSEAAVKTKMDILFYIRKAKAELGRLDSSSFKQGLLDLTDFMAKRIR